MYLLEILTSICISHILVFILLALIRFKKINYYIAMGIGIIAYLLFPLAIKYDFPKFIKLILFIWIVSISFFFWLISIDLSKKYFHPGKKYWAILILKLIISIWSIRPERTFFFLSPTDEIIKNFLRFLPPATFSAVLIILSLYNLYQNLNHDLVDSQKKIRQEILIISGFTAAVILILRLILHSKELEFYFFLTVHSITLFCIYMFSLTNLKLNESLFIENSSKEKQKAIIDQELLIKLNKVFEEEKYFKEEGLTIRQLSGYMNVPEHHLRRLINGGLGFKNFNDFLNKYRIQEACEILLTKKKQDMPIIRIAMDLGYKSLASFNKAFKEINGMTPSEFREKM